MLVECVINVSEGRDGDVLRRLDAAAGPMLRDRHSDPDHHRSVFTLVGPAADVATAAHTLATETLRLVDLRTHEGVHPRLGALDVVPFVPYAPGADPPDDLTEATALRDAFARWLADTCAVPAFLYGPLADGASRTLPDVRRHAFTDLAPDAGPAHAHPSAGACAVGARTVLIAYNVWVPTLEVARHVAPLVRSPAVRALALEVGTRAQVSCNLLRPSEVGPDRLYDDVAARAAEVGSAPQGAELVGLIPAAVLARIAPERWAELDLSEQTTVESRL